MTRNMNVFVTTGVRFIYKIIYEKWAKIESKMAIKCFKKVQISYNLDLICISSGFINWQKIFEKYWKLADFWTKNRFFALEFQYFFFDGNRYSSFRNTLIDLFFWIHIPIYLYYNIMKSFFEKLFLFVNYCTFYATKEHFFTIFHHFRLKNALLWRKRCNNSRIKTVFQKNSS